MKRLLLVFALAVATVFGAVDERNGIPISSSSTINGVTPLSAINGQAVTGGLQPETALWKGRVIAAGGTFEVDSIAIADALVIALKAETFYSDLVYFLPFLGADIIAARVPLLDTLNVGIALNDGSANFVDADFDQSLGLQGNGSSKLLNTTILPSQLGTTNNGGMLALVKTISFAGTDTVIAGVYYDDIGDHRYLLDLRSGLKFFSWGAVGNRVNVASAAIAASYYGQRSSDVLREFWENNSSIGTNTTTDSAVGANDTAIRVMGSITSNTGAKFYNASLLSCLILTTGELSSGEVTALNTTLGTYLTTATGR